jgi:hypothetical protein
MRRGFDFDGMDDDSEPLSSEPTPVVDLPYYESLREFLEPFTPAEKNSADKYFTSAEIIRAIEEHHGVPQGPVAKGDVHQWVLPEDFTRAMKKLGFRSANLGGQLQWMLKKR